MSVPTALLDRRTKALPRQHAAQHYANKKRFTVKSLEILEEMAVAGSQLHSLSGSTALLASWIEENRQRLKPHDLSLLVNIGGALFGAEAELTWKTMSSEEHAGLSDC